MRRFPWIPVLLMLAAAPAAGASSGATAPAATASTTQSGNFRFFPGIGAVPQGNISSNTSFVFTPGVGFVPAGNTQTNLFQFVPGTGFVPRASTFSNQGDFIFVPNVGFVPRAGIRDARLTRRLSRFHAAAETGFVPVLATVNVAGRPFVEAEVIRILPTEIVVRFPVNGVLVTRTFPLSDVFFLQNGVLVTAGSVPLSVGQQVLVAPAAARAAVVSRLHARRVRRQHLRRMR
jgi:hypothetical protein